MAEPASTEPGPRRTRRRVALVATMAVIAGGLAAATGIARSGDGDDAPQASERCPAGVDRLALEADTYVRNDELSPGFTSIGVQRTDDDAVTWLNEPRQVMTQPSFSPAGDQVAVRWADGDYESSGPASESIWVVDVADGNARPVTLGTSDHAPAWSPDGRTIAYVHQERDGGGTVMTVPAEGGPSSDLLQLELDAWGARLTWTPDGDLLVSDADRGLSRTIVHRIDAEGDVEELARFEGAAWTGTVVDGDLLLRVRPERTEPASILRSVDLEDGTVSDVSGPEGHLAASSGGERLYLLDDDGDLYRATYDGSSVVTTDAVATGVEVPLGFAVGACSTGPDPDPVPDRPLLGTDWRLSFRRLAVLPGPPVAGCEEPDCTRIRIAVTEDYEDPEATTEPCVVVTGALRGEALRADDIAIGGGEGCERFAGWEEQPPVGLGVDGDLLRLVFGQPRTTETHTVTYGAWYAGDEPSGSSDDLPSDEQLDAVVATTTTTAPPPPAECAVVDEFARDLAAASIEVGSPDASTPEELAAASTAVLRGRLVDGGLVSEVEAPADAALAYDLRVTEVLAGAAPGVAVGEVVPVLLPFRFGEGDDLPPALGALGATVVGPGSPPLGSIDAVAFLTDEGGAWPGDLLVNGSSGLAVACEGRAPGGLVGTGSAWETADLDELATAVREG